ncbi:MAG TPA: hypothetical protein VGZ00_12145 [Candidatus Baltobacteraceae bacterium]|nr:hypothetical protein [Candidatus Baltobacteraceae bacterium]
MPAAPAKLAAEDVTTSPAATDLIRCLPPFKICSVPTPTPPVVMKGTLFFFDGKQTTAGRLNLQTRQFEPSLPLNCSYDGTPSFLAGASLNGSVLYCGGTDATGLEGGSVRQQIEVATGAIGGTFEQLIGEEVKHKIAWVPGTSNELYEILDHMLLRFDPPKVNSPTWQLDLPDTPLVNPPPFSPDTAEYVNAVTIDPQGRYLYTYDSYSGKFVSVEISAAGGNYIVAFTLPPQTSLTGITVAPSGTFAYALSSHFTPGGLVRINLTARTVTNEQSTLKLGSDVLKTAFFNPAGTAFYVLDNVGRLTEINAQTNAVVRTVTLPGVTDAAISTDGNSLLTIAATAAGASSLTIRNASTLAATGTIAAPAGVTFSSPLIVR